MTIQDTKEWREFDEKFCGSKSYFYFSRSPSEIKDFISSNFIPITALEKVIKREYLRGYINGGAEGNTDYTVESLDKIYEEYTKHNPDLLTFIKEQSA